MPSGIYIRTEEAKQNMSDAHKGKKPSKETKRKMSIARKGENHPMYGKHHSKESIKKISESKKGQIAWNKGIPFSEESKQKMSESHQNISEETRQKMSESQLGKIVWNKGIKCPETSGENNGMWKGGITTLTRQIRCSFEYRQWRSDVYTRDNFICQECGQWGGKLHAHHIKLFASILQKYEITTLEEAIECEELWNINNGITLCKECHRKINHKEKIKWPWQ